MRTTGYVKGILSLFAGVFLCFSTLWGQGYQQSYNEAMQLYRNKMYQNALASFNKTIGIMEKEGAVSQLDKALGYKLLCQIYLKHQNLERQIEEYLQKYPSSTVASSVRLKGASYISDKGDYNGALKLLEGMESSDIEKQERDEFYYRKGVCLMKVPEYDMAMENLSKVGRGSEYYYESRYFMGYIEYTVKEFEEAVPYFTESSRSSKFALSSQSYILQCRFMLKDYKYVTDYGPALYNKLDGEEKIRVARIISESYYALGESALAEKYFKNYSNALKGESRTDTFYSALISYSLKNYNDAAEKFERMLKGGVKDSLAQNAYYRLAKCYLERKDKVSAYEAFEMASVMNWNPGIKEDAAFNGAKLAFDLYGKGNKLYDYLATYNVGTEKKDEVYSYIATNSLIDRKYEKAIEALLKITNMTAADMGNLKKAYFFRGVELLEEGRYPLAEEYLGNATDDRDVNRQLSNLASFYLAEALFRQEKYSQSLGILEQVQSDGRFKTSAEYPVSFFNSGYDNFRLKQLDKAVKDFEKYLSLTSSKGDYALESKLRIADCKFMQRDFKAASSLYDEVARYTSSQSLYAPLQSAIAQGLLQNNKKKIEILGSITSVNYSSAEHYTEALYELGRTYLQTNNNSLAKTTFKRLLNDAPDNRFYYKALLELGMMASNEKNFSEAKDYYKKVVEQSPVKEEQQTALNALENIYQAENKPEEFLAYAADKDVTGETEEEKERFIFNSAEQIYLSEKYEAAASALEKFMERFPQSKNMDRAIYYLADSYTKCGEYAKAAGIYGMLETLATDVAHKESYAMRKIELLYKAEEFNKTVLEASSFIEKYSNEEARRKALYYKGKSLWEEGEREDAVEALEDVAENPKDEMGAEAAYLLIKDAFDSGNFDKVETLVFALSEQKTGERFYLAKSYLLLGDSYLEKGDKEGAKQVYQSIYKSYNGQGDIKAVAKSKMEAIGKK